MRTTTKLKGSWFGSAWFARYRSPKRATWKLKTEEVQFQTWPKSGKLKTATDSILGALFGYVRHKSWTGSLNKVCCTQSELQLIFKVQLHASTLNHWSTRVKQASWKRHFQADQHIAADFSKNMNINSTWFLILSCSKLFRWSNNIHLHYQAWS